MTDDRSKETLSLAPQKKAPGRPPKRQRKYKRGDNARTWDYVPEELKNSNLDYEWKNTHVLGQEVQPDYHVTISDQGWEPVRAEDFRGMLPETWTKPTVERRGQILMQRPKELTEEARAEERATANEQLRGKLEQLGMAPRTGQFQQKVTKFKNTFERVEVPEE